MKPEDREILNRAAGILEGLSACGELSGDITETIIAVCDMIDKGSEGGIGVKLRDMLDEDFVSVEEDLPPWTSLSRIYRGRWR